MALPAGKAVADAVLDTCLQFIKDNCSSVIVVSTDPLTVASAQATSCFIVSQAVLSGDWSIADGASSGRKIMYSGRTGFTVSFTGGASMLIFAGTVSAANSILWKTTVTGQTLTAGNPCTINAVTYTIPDPS